MKSIRNAVLVIILVLSFSGVHLRSADAQGSVNAACTSSGQAIPTGDISGWRQIFTEDFAGGALDQTRWGMYEGQPANDPAGWWSPSHVSVNNCALTLSGYRDTPVKPGVYVTGGIGMKENIIQPYGKYLVRMRVDKGNGLSAIALLWPQAPTWPPEIDFYEDAGGNRSSTSATLHCGANGDNSCLIHKELSGYDFSQWHTVGVEWTKGKLNYTIDGTVWASITDSRISSIPMNLDLQLQSLECGPYNTCVDGTTPAVVNMQVDWVVVYEATSPTAGRIDGIGTFSNGVFYLRNANTAGNADLTVAFNPNRVATSKLLPVVGDWNGDGIDTVGVYDTSNGLFSLSSSNTAPTVQYSLAMGIPGDQPLAGRWATTMSGAGTGVYRPSNGLLYARKTLTTGYADYTMVLGIPGDSGIAGDWDGNGLDSMGVYRPGTNTVYLANQVAGPNGIATVIFGDYSFNFGNAAAYFVAGDWQGSGATRVGYYLNGTFYLKYGLNSGGADYTFAYGTAGSRPVAGRWIATGNDPAPQNVIVDDTSLSGVLLSDNTNAIE